MVCLLTLNPFVTSYGSAYAAASYFTPTAEISLSILIDKQGSLKGYGAQENFKRHAGEIAEEGQEFIASLKGADKNILKTPEGARFLNEHSRLSRIEALKRKMNACVNNKDNKRGLESQILTSTENAEYSAGCDYRLFGQRNGLITNSNLDDFVKDLDRTQRIFNNGSTIGPSNLQDSLHMQALKNSLKSYLSLRYKYEPEFISPETGKFTDIDKQGRSKQVKKVLDDMCGKETSTYNSSSRKYSNNFCSPTQRSELRKYTLQSAKDVAFTQKKSNWGDALSNIKNNFKSLNDDYLDHIDLKTNYAGKDAANVADKTAQGKWNQYKLKYIESIQSQDGLLMMSPLIKEKSGGIRRLDTDTTHDRHLMSWNKKYYVKPHEYKGITDVDLKASKNQIQERIVTQAKQLNQMAQEKRDQEKKFKKNGSPYSSVFGTDQGDIMDKRKEDLVKLVKTNPAAVGQLLVNEPQWADLVCAAINKIDDNDVSDAKWDKVWMVGGLIVAGVVIVGGAILVATGLGAPLGAVMIGSGVTIGSAATATVLVLGAAEATYWGTRTYDHHKEHQDLEMAVLSGNNNDYEAVERAYADFKDARFNFLMSLPAVVLPGIGKIASFSKGSRFTGSVGRMTAPTKELFLKNYANFFKLLKSNPKVAKFVDALVTSRKLKAEKIHEFFETLASARGNVNTNFLNWLKTKIPDPSDKAAYNKFLATVHKIIDEGLESAAKACKL
jgi:hypothetical protein